MSSIVHTLTLDVFHSVHIDFKAFFISLVASLVPIVPQIFLSSQVSLIYFYVF